MKTILAVQEAHDAAAAIMIDGTIVAAAQEERFSGLKGDYGFPRQAVKACLKAAGIDSQQIDKVLLCTEAWNPVLTKIKRNANFSVDDWVTEQREFWKPTLLEGKSVRYYDLFKDNPDFAYDDFYPLDDVLDGYMDEAEMRKMKEIRIDTIAAYLEIDRNKIEAVRHEECHTFYSYFASPLRGEVLALTAEGIGDYCNGSVSTFNETGRTELSYTKENHIGHIYQYITLVLGMKPAQHEYKVMGLAPYANSHEVAKSFKAFAKVLKVEGLDIVFDQKPEDLYFHFRDALEGHRFDGIAGAVQQFTEQLLCDWTRACVEHSGLKRICFSGGVAQNIKAAMTMMELDCVDDIYICPAAGDTSIPIGGCYYAMWQHLRETGGDVAKLKPLDSMYLGPEFSNEDILKTLGETGAENRYSVRRDVTPEQVASLLADGKIIARCSGKMEFGLRALGNRSILADPRNPDTVRKINQAIKFRDFWMPFTPSILAERADDYLVNPKGIRSPFMTMAFNTTELAHKDILAALHPADFTARPQILEREHNPEYYDIISEFEKLTGIGAVLNTSFNLHGDPIVLGPKEAIYTLDNSELDGLLMNNILLERK